MSTSLTGSIKVVLDMAFKNTLDLSTITDPLKKTINIALADGTGADKAQVVWHDERTLATTTGEDIDLAGALACAYGVVTFTKIKAILIYVTTTTAGYRLEIGGSPNGGPLANWVGDAASDKIKITAGGLNLLVCPDAAGIGVTAGSADDLYVYNPSGGSVVYDIVVVGEGSVA